uniref:Ovule protein n=1 Tax=Parascaris equorum TaxID=6256 RepID=A0A914RZJ8_PAREQ
MAILTKPIIHKTNCCDFVSRIPHLVINSNLHTLIKETLHLRSVATQVTTTKWTETTQIFDHIGNSWAELRISTHP